jgi:hypothetical protein
LSAIFILIALSAVAYSQQIAAGAAATLPDAPEAPSQSQSNSPDTTQTGSIHGVIVDREGAVYEGVRVTLTPTGPNATQVRTTTSDANGGFQFTGVPPGPFQLTIASPGFKSQIISGTLSPGQSFEAPKIILSFAATTQVEVTASREEVAEAQLKEEEQQRVFGAIPNFYVVYAPNAQPLTSRQKFRLAWRTSIDPITFLAAGAFAGIEQATNEFSGYGQGAQGYAKRFGASYADSFDATMIGSAILPSLLHQDPRYFYKGTGTTRSRILYAIANSVICKSDKGIWQPNYSGILGSLAAGGISNLYYPASDRNGASLTFENLALATAGGAVQNLFQEFVVRKLTPKAPHYSPSKP